MLLKRFLYLDSVRALILVLSLWACPVSLTWAQAPPAPANVLILHSHDFGLPAYDKIQEGLETVLRSGGIRNDNLNVEFLDLGQNSDPEHAAIVNRLLRKRYAGRKIDLIITTYTPALNFMAREGKDFLPHVPLIAMLGPESLGDRKMDRPVILAPGRMDMSGTLKSATGLLPDTRRVLVINGPSELDRRYENQARRDFKDFSARLEFEFLSNLPLEDMLRKVAVQPPHTVIMYLNFSRDITGRPFTPRDVLESISARANAPVFGLYDTLIDYGVVGGAMLSFHAEGIRAGNLALDILKGKAPAGSSPNDASNAKFIFDWKQLKRWGLSEARLPAGSLVLNRPDSAWDRYKATILGILGFILLLCCSIIALFLNILKRKRVEGALQESEERFRAIFERSTVGNSLTLPDGKLLRINKAFADILGYTAEDMQHLDFAQITHPDDMAESRECVRALLAGEQTIYRLEKRYLRKTGDIVWADVSTTLLRDEKGAPLYFITSIVDITERKLAEGKRRDLEERLQRSEKMEALGTLAGGVAHDLNNVLGIVVGYAEALVDEIDESSPLREDAVKIVEGGERSAAIVQDLLTLARRGVQARKVFNLNAAIADCQKTPEFEKAVSLSPGIRIITDFDASLLNIVGSPMHLCKTFVNLVTNAVESMSGGGLLTVATSNRSLDRPVHGYDAVNPGDYVVLTVTDTGEGISGHDIKHIFEPFYTKKVMGKSGTGLGLAVVWGTVKDHNGYIDVQSEPGKGTTFTLYFPVTREEIADAEAAVPLCDYFGNDESILVIDDIKEQRELATKLLGKLNYRVKTVASGEEAVEYLQTNKADLLVLDMIMDPGMDGLDTYKAILQIHPNQKALIVSGFSQTDRVTEAQASGAGEYLRKPYLMERLGVAVRKELDRI